MRPAGVDPKVVAHYTRRNDSTVRRMCEKGKIEAVLFCGDWIISIEDLKRKFWRIGRETWKRIIYDFYKDAKDAEEAWEEFLRIESEERGKNQCNTAV